MSVCHSMAPAYSFAEAHWWFGRCQFGLGDRRRKTGGMRVYPTFFRLAFSWMDAERAHKIGFRGIRLANTTGAGKVLQKFTAPPASLETKAFGVTFPSPFGLAAGFD